MVRPSFAAACCSLIAVLGSGCSAVLPKAQAPQMPTPLTRCQVAASRDNPLVAEWPASEKANLEARLREGTVAVAYSGCTLRLLPQCRPSGGYRWRRTTTTTDAVEIRDTDELYTKLPLGAVSLEGELARSGRLSVQTTVSGQLENVAFDPATMINNPWCVGATHVLGALSIGAFKLRSGGSITGGVGAGVPGVGTAKGTASNSESVLREAGTFDACMQSTDAMPHPECSSPIQVFLRALPSYIVDRGPPGTIKVSFVSGEANQSWDVVVGDRTLCKTPCERWIDPMMPYGMQSEAGFLQKDHRVQIPDLRDHASRAPLQVRAHPRSIGEQVGGITATTFGGMGVAAGIALWAVGASKDSSGMTNAGRITLPLSAILTGVGIWLIIDSGERVQLTPLPSAQPAPPQPNQPW